MAATGTITLTRNNTTVTGSGSDFTTDLLPGGFIVATVGGTAYTLGIKSIESNTSLTLQIAYKGETTSGLSFDYVPLATLNLITSALAAQVNEALRANNLDRNNWQQIYSGTGDVTVRLPDGTSWTGPAWNGIAATVANKAAKGDNSDITSLTGLKTALSIAQGGTGAKSKEDAWAALATFGNTPGTAAQGNDARLSSIDGKSGGTVNGDISATGNVKSTTTGYGFTKDKSGTASNKNLMVLGYLSDNQYSIYDIAVDSNDVYSRLYTQNGSGGSMFYFGAGGTGQSKSGWTTYSDSRVKTEKEKITNALDKINQLSGYTYTKFGQRQTGVIAQEVQSVLPEAVTASGFDVTLEDGTVIKNALSLSPGDLVGLLIEGIKALAVKSDSRDSAIDDIQERLKALDGLDK